MKRLLIVPLVIIMLFAGCYRENSKANRVTVFYGFTSYAMSSTDQKVIDDLLGKFNSLSFEKADDELDPSSAFHVNFSYNGDKAESFCVDKNGIFQLNGETRSYRVSSGSFDYEYLKKIYEDSKRRG